MMTGQTTEYIGSIFKIICQIMRIMLLSVAGLTKKGEYGNMEKLLLELGAIILDIGGFALERWKRGDFKTEQVLHRSRERMDFKAIDREITERVVGKLSSLGVTNRFLTEEGMDDPRYNQQGGLRWVSDELDGTSNFASGELDWGHSIAFENNGETVCAALFTPVRGELLLASKTDAYFLDTYGIKPADVDLNLTPPQPFKTNELRYRLRKEV